MKFHNVCVCARMRLHIWARSTLIQKYLWLLLTLCHSIDSTWNLQCSLLYIFKHTTKRMYSKHVYTNYQATKKERESEKKKFLIICCCYFFFYLAMNRKINQNDDDALVCAMSIQITYSKQTTKWWEYLGKIHSTIAILEYDIYNFTRNSICSGWLKHYVVSV